MDRRFLTVLGVSLVFALVVSSIFYQMTARGARESKPDPGEMTDLVTASRPLPIGSTIKPDDLKLRKVPPAQFPAGAFHKVEEVIDRAVMSNILQDEPVLEGRLAARGSGMGLAPIIPVGMRAVTVRVNDVVSVAGFVLPGMRVDVLVTGRPPGSDDSMTTTVLQNILVLSAGTTIQPDTRGQAIQAPNVTLLVTPEQAQEITLASAEGRIQLILRNSSDQKIEATAASGTSELYGHKAPARQLAQAVSRPAPRPRQEAAAAPLPPPPPVPDQVITIRGTTKQVEQIPSRTPGA
jgi:pilus assembly protein CpaB